MSQYLPIIVLVVLAVLFGLITFGASRLLAPRRPSSAKTAPYESGIVPSREPPERFPVSFYVVAMLFIMFDIEIIFLYPYAVTRKLSVSMDSWRSSSSPRCSSSRSCTRWRGRSRLRSAAALPQPGHGCPHGHAGRTAATTIRRVGTEGRPAPGGGGVAMGLVTDIRETAWPGCPTTSSPAASRNSSSEAVAQLVARQLRPRLLRHRDDGDRRRPLRPVAVRDGGLPCLAAPGRHHDRRRPGQPEDGARAAAGLRPDDGTKWVISMGVWRVDRRHVQQLRTRSRRGPRSCPWTSMHQAARPRRRLCCTPSRRCTRRSRTAS